MTFIKMGSYTIQQYVQIVELFYENRCSVKNVFRKLRDTVCPNWPLRSCDLTPLDYFLWDYVKRVHKNNLQSIPELKYKIIRVIGDRATVMPKCYPKCYPKFWQKNGFCGAARDGYLTDIIFYV